MVDKIAPNLSPPIQPAGPAPGQAPGQAPATNPPAGAAPASGSGSFTEALAAQTLRFSAHAQARLKTRDIELTEQDQSDLARAVEMAGAKGAQESLILFDDLALIVNVRNKVVITALERGEAQANVFTHIDSAVVLPRGRIDTSA